MVNQKSIGRVSAIAASRRHSFEWCGEMGARSRWACSIDAGPSFLWITPFERGKSHGKRTYRRLPLRCRALPCRRDDPRRLLPLPHVPEVKRRAGGGVGRGATRVRRFHPRHADRVSLLGESLAPLLRNLRLAALLPRAREPGARHQPGDARRTRARGAELSHLHGLAAALAAYHRRSATVSGGAPDVMGHKV